MDEPQTPAELSTHQVAEYLQVKTATVYAYVSRGTLTPTRRDSRGASYFSLDAVRALADGRTGRRRPAATSNDVRTRITHITPGGLAFRGRPIGQIAASSTYEQVRELLTGLPEPDPHAPAPGLDDARHALAALPPGLAPLELFKHATLLAGATDPGRHDRSPEGFASAARRTATFMAHALSPEVAVGPLADQLAPHLAPCPRELIELALVVLADHDLAISTTAVRVAVSSRADPYSAYVAGLAVGDSPAHVGASLHAVDWLTAALGDPQSALDRALAGERPPGWGHIVYTEEDPRATLLLNALGPHADAEAMATLRHLHHELFTRRGWLANIDIALALLTTTFGLPRHAGTVLFACARTAGWAAHAIEELAEPALRFRLKGVYSGARNEDEPRTGFRCSSAPLPPYAPRSQT